jgi:hypothetical protein
MTPFELSFVTLTAEAHWQDFGLVSELDVVIAGRVPDDDEHARIVMTFDQEDDGDRYGWVYRVELDDLLLYRDFIELDHEDRETAKRAVMEPFLRHCFLHYVMGFRFRDDMTSIMSEYEATRAGVLAGLASERELRRREAAAQPWLPGVA